MKVLLVFLLWLPLITAAKTKEDTEAERQANAAVEARLKVALSNCSTAVEAQAVVKWGVALSAKDGSWLAIAYEDSHSSPWVSVAVARTGDGTWLRSHFHFCAVMSDYRRKRDEGKWTTLPGDQLAEALGKLPEIQQKVFAPFIQIERSQTLDLRSVDLKALEFEVIEVPKEPRTKEPTKEAKP